jgi:hypothetical protein
LPHREHTGALRGHPAGHVLAGQACGQQPRAAKES